MLDTSRYPMFYAGSPALNPSTYNLDSIKLEGGPRHWSFRFRVFKFIFDYATAIIALPTIFFVGLALLVLNPFFNPGPLLFSQVRMGRYGEPFRMWKFRTMSCADPEARSADDKLEEHRISKLGGFMRRTRIDELPNFFNVIRGQMSVIGPRPDAYHHASAFERSLPGYKERHRVLPGITGLAQVEMGYAEGAEETELKAFYDNIYAARSCGRLDLYIIGQTFKVVLGAKGR